MSIQMRLHMHRIYINIWTELHMPCFTMSGTVRCISQWISNRMGLLFIQLPNITSQYVELQCKRMRTHIYNTSLYVYVHEKIHFACALAHIHSTKKRVILSIDTQTQSLPSSCLHCDPTTFPAWGFSLIVIDFPTQSGRSKKVQTWNFFPNDSAMSL